MRVNPEPAETVIPASDCLPLATLPLDEEAEVFVVCMTIEQARRRFVHARISSSEPWDCQKSTFGRF